MPRTLQFIIMFVVAVLLQTVLLDNLSFGVWFHPLIYIAFIALLPMELAPVWVLLLGFALGGVVDLVSGGAGLNTSATLLTAFARPLLLRTVVDKEDMREGGLPTIDLLGTKGFLRYCIFLCSVHCLAYFSLEAATWSYFYLTLIRIVISTAATVGLVYFFQLFYAGR